MKKENKRYEFKVDCRLYYTITAKNQKEAKDLIRYDWENNGTPDLKNCKITIIKKEK